MMTEIDNCYKGSKLPWCEIESDIESESEFGDEEFYQNDTLDNVNPSDIAPPMGDIQPSLEEDADDDASAISAWNILTNSKLWIDPTAGITLNNILETHGISKPTHLKLIANIPKIMNELVSLLKTIPQKDFIHELQSYNTLRKSPFCPVCRDKGLPAEKYTSHHIWGDEQRKIVICPTLLSTTCNICKKTGHSPKYCKSSSTIPPQPTVQSSPPPPPLPQSPVISRMILPTTCLTCNQLGHTSKYCRQLIFTDNTNKPYLSIFPSLSSNYIKSPNNIPLSLSTINVQNEQIHTYITYASYYLEMSNNPELNKHKRQYYLEQSIYYTRISETYIQKYYLDCVHNFNM